VNINIKLNIPFKDATGTLKVETNTLLSPFYVSEKEVLSTFLETYNESQFNSMREIIFFNSMKADDFIKDNLKDLPERELAMFKRNLVICLSTVAFGNKFNSDFLKSLSRSKSLADFSVSTTAVNDPQFVVNIINDAKQCVEEARELIEAISLGGEGLIKSFVKGELNANTIQTNRLWHHYNLPIKSTETYASQKKPFNGRFYKNGGNF
jgi:hypothetical protein